MGTMCWCARCTSRFNSGVSNHLKERDLVCPSSYRFAFSIPAVRGRSCSTNNFVIRGSYTVLGKVKDFLGVMAEANKRLQLDAQEKSREDYDIEVLNRDETKYIEMDLVLGVADLHTPEAVAAAESAMAGSQPSFPSSATTIGSDSEEEEDDDDDNDDDDADDDDDDNADDDDDDDDDNDEEDKSNFHTSSTAQPKKRPKIIELN